MQALLDAGADRVSLADTVGCRRPAMVGALFERPLAIAGERLWCGHFHDTRGLGLANVLAALQCGVTRFDACLAGIGGCPHAPARERQRRQRGPWPTCWAAWASTPARHRRLLSLRAEVAGWLQGETLHGTLARAGLLGTFAAARGGLRETQWPSTSTKTPWRPLAPAGSMRGARCRSPASAWWSSPHMVMGPTCGMIPPTSAPK